MRRRASHRRDSHPAVIAVGATLAANARGAVAVVVGVRAAVAEAVVAMAAVVASAAPVVVAATATDKLFFFGLKVALRVIFRPTSGLQPNKYGREQLLFL